MARVACILARGSSGHQHEWGRAFGAGLQRHGWRFNISPHPEHCDLLVLWGVRRQAEIEAQIARGGEVCVLERGYIGDRFKWTSVSFGGNLNGRARFRGVRSDPSRFDRHFGALMRPWRKQEGYTLVIGQVPGDMSLRPVGGHLDEWYAKVMRQCFYEAVFRPHPVAVKRGMVRVPRGARLIDGTLDKALSGAARVVTFNSNTAVESVLAGVPTVTMDMGSMAWDVTSHTIGKDVTPDRSEWAARLAWCQWTLQEIERGDCWEAICQAQESCGTESRSTA